MYLQTVVGRNKKGRKADAKFDKKKMLNLMQHLETIIKGLKLVFRKTTWSNYYEETILGKDYLKAKENIFRNISRIGKGIKPLTLVPMTAIFHAYLPKLLQS